MQLGSPGTLVSGPQPTAVKMPRQPHRGVAPRPAHSEPWRGPGHQPASDARRGVSPQILKPRPCAPAPSSLPKHQRGEPATPGCFRLLAHRLCEHENPFMPLGLGICCRTAVIRMWGCPGAPWVAACSPVWSWGSCMWSWCWPGGRARESCRNQQTRGQKTPGCLVRRPEEGLSW